MSFGGMLAGEVGSSYGYKEPASALLSEERQAPITNFPTEHQRYKSAQMSDEKIYKRANKLNYNADTEHKNSSQSGVLSSQNRHVISNDSSR